MLSEPAKPLGAVGSGAPPATIWLTVTNLGSHRLLGRAIRSSVAESLCQVAACCPAGQACQLVPAEQQGPGCCTAACCVCASWQGAALLCTVLLDVYLMEVLLHLLLPLLLLGGLGEGGGRRKVVAVQMTGLSTRHTGAVHDGLRTL